MRYSVDFKRIREEFGTCFLLLFSRRKMSFFFFGNALFFITLKVFLPHPKDTIYLYIWFSACGLFHFRNIVHVKSRFGYSSGISRCSEAVMKEKLWLGFRHLEIPHGQILHRHKLIAQMFQSLIGPGCTELTGKCCLLHSS